MAGKKNEICFGKGRNIVGKGENAGCQSPMFSNCLQMFSRSLKVAIVWERVKTTTADKSGRI